MSQSAGGLQMFSIRCATKAALKWLHLNGHCPDDLRHLNSAIAREITLATPAALNDAKAALDANMVDAAMETMAASMVIAGIAAAKSCV